MSFARVYIAAHYPQDVVAGLLLGAAVATVTYLAGRGLATWLLSAVARTPLATLVRATPPAPVVAAREDMRV